MAQFSAYLPLLDKVEGGYQKLASDSGNYNSLGQLVGTNYGISAKTYEAWIGYPPTESDMRAMPKNVAIDIFYNWYWIKMKGDSFKNQSVANIIIDHAVNAGVRTATKLLQKVLNESFYKNIAVDGIIGNQTISATNSVNQEQLHEVIKLEREAYYKSIGGTFLTAWLNRLKGFFLPKKKHFS